MRPPSKLAGALRAQGAELSPETETQSEIISGLSGCKDPGRRTAWWAGPSFKEELILKMIVKCVVQSGTKDPRG